MNIANIMGLHLGCWVKISRTGEKGKIINISTSLSNIGGGIIIIEDLFSGTKAKYIKDCKLLLKPVSKITDEDKAEFQKKYVKVNDFVSRLRVEFYNNLSYGVYKRSTSGWSENTEHKLSIDQLLWLCSKGYDIGLVPDEYKEVEE